MRTMKLAVSVYALTLVLGANNALGATVLGVANPSCGGNTFNLQYVSPRAGSGCSISSESTSVIYGGDFTFATADAGKNCYTNPGYDLDGWNIHNGANSVLVLSTQGLGAKVTLAEPMFGDDVYPAINSTYYIKPAWKANAITISLNRGGGTGGLSEIYREGLKLYSTFSNNTYSNEITINKAITALPTRAGYEFAGYFSSEGSAYNYVSAIIYPNSEQFTYTSDYCASLGTDKAWTETNGAGITNCPWIKSDGKLASSYLPTGIAKLGTSDTTIYAGWEPITFIVKYAKGGLTTSSTGNVSCSEGMCIMRPTTSGLTNDLLFKPNNDTISFDEVAVDLPYECRYNTNYLSGMNKPEMACGQMINPTTTSASFKFNGWQVTVDNGTWADGSDSSEAKIFENTNALNNALLTLTQTKDAILTVTARWTADVKTVNIKATSDADDIAATYIFSPKDGWSAYEDGSLTKTIAFDSSVLTSPTVSVNGKSVDTTFRGLSVHDGTGWSDVDIADIVDETTTNPWLTTLGDLQGGFVFMIANHLGIWNSNYDAVANVFDQLNPEEDGSYTVYARWAQNCNPGNDNTTCKLTMGSNGAGSVTYTNTCDSGYNIDGYEEVVGTASVAE